VFYAMWERSFDLQAVSSVSVLFDPDRGAP